MESQLDRAHAHIHEQEQPHHTHVVEGEEEHQHEKKSVLKKVKAKAKKIKDTLMHGHGHDHDHQEHVPDDHDLDEEEEDEEEEIVEDPEINGAPRQVGNVENSGVSPGGSTGMDVNPLAPSLKPESHVHGPDGAREPQKVTVGSTTVMGDVPRAPQNTPVSYNAPGINQTRDNVSSRTGMGDIPHAAQNVPVPCNPPGVHLSRDNVTGRTVVGDVPHAPQNVPVSLDPPGIHYSKENVPSSNIMGSDVHDHPGIHVSRDDTPSRTVIGSVDHHSRDSEHPSRTFAHCQEDRPGLPKVNLERPKGLEEDLAAPKDTPGAYTSSNYQTKVTDPTGKGGEEAGITPILHSFNKMNVSDESEGKTRQEHDFAARDEDLLTSVSTGSHDQFSPELTPPTRVPARETFDSTNPQEYSHDEAVDRPSNQGSYTDKISSATSAVADKAISAKNAEASKLGYGEKDNTGGHEMHPPQGEGVESPSSKQGGYTEKISSATYAIADKAIGAKNVVVSKLGYGEKDNKGGHEMHPHEGGEKNSTPSSMTQKLAPIYEKVAGAGSAVMSKIPGTGTWTGNDTTTGNQSGVEVGQDKGVSVKGYFAEKLRPGEEDRALSEVISEALHKRKPEQAQQATRPVTEVVSDAMHKRKEEPDEVTTRPMGTVTESEEVARRLGTTKDDHEHGIGNKGMVDKIKGAVGSWLGKGDQSQGSQISSSSDDVGHNSNISGERRLQESGN